MLFRESEKDEDVVEVDHYEDIACLGRYGFMKAWKRIGSVGSPNGMT